MKILLVDDDKFLQKLNSSKLKQLGFEVDIAVDGENALSQMKETKPTLVLLDLIMPKKDGFTVLAEAQADPEISKIPIIVLSSLSQESDLKRIKELGAKGYFDKNNTDYDQLKKKILSLTPSS